MKLPEDTKDLLRQKVQSGRIKYGLNKFELAGIVPTSKVADCSDSDVNLRDPKKENYNLSQDQDNSLFDFLSVFGLIWEFLKFENAANFTSQ